MLDLLGLQGRDWKLSSTPILRKIAVVDLDMVPKVWIYLFYHTLHTNWSDYELITMSDIGVYLLLI